MNRIETLRRVPMFSKGDTVTTSDGSEWTVSRYEGDGWVRVYRYWYYMDNTSVRDDAKVRESDLRRANAR
jgi:hypothetical protein